MARNFTPRGHIERREGEDLSLFTGDRKSKFSVDVLPGEHGAKSSKLSGYGKQLRAKQKAKRMYGLLERQFRKYFKSALQKTGSTGDNLLRLLECRLDNVVWRLGLARTRKEARQLVSHKGIEILNSSGQQIVNIPSYQVRTGDEIILREACRAQGRVQEAIELAKQRTLPEWLSIDVDHFKGVVKRMPERDEMPMEVDDLLIIELYSK
ncbi:MAG: 30S ribosomal protein S4 [Pseudomonadota bacterium]